MKLKLIAAIADNGVIGIDNTLPWRLPEDWAFFKKTTMGCPVIMGRKTWDSIGRPLPGRLNIVLTRDTQWRPGPDKEGKPRAVTCYPSEIHEDTKIAIAHDLPKVLHWVDQHDTLFLIGGSNLYEQALNSDLVDELILTEIHQEFEGDAYFPKWDPSKFTEVARECNAATTERSWTFDFVQYSRTNKS